MEMLSVIETSGEILDDGCLRQYQAGWETTGFFLNVAFTSNSETIYLS